MAPHKHKTDQHLAADDEDKDHPLQGTVGDTPALDQRVVLGILLPESREFQHLPRARAVHRGMDDVVPDAEQQPGPQISRQTGLRESDHRFHVDSPIQVLNLGGAVAATSFISSQKPATMDATSRSPLSAHAAVASPTTPSGFRS